MVSKRIIGLTIAGALAYCIFTGCAGTRPGKGYNDNIPDEIEKLTKTKYKTAIFAIGNASGPTENIAQEKAVLLARAEISKQFKSQIDALQKMYEESVNDKSVEEYKHAIELFATMEISGSTIAKTLARKEKKGFSAVVLVVLSAEQMKAMMDEKLNQITSFKASKAYKELEDRVAKEKEGQKEDKQ